MKKLKLKKLTFMEIFFLIIIASYAFDFGIIKYALTWMYILLDVLFSIKHNDGIYKFGKCGRKYLNILVGISILIFITIILQIKNGFHLYSINEIIFLLTPIMFAICYTKSMDKDKIDATMRKSFIVFGLSFIYKFFTELTLHNVFSISFINSYSPFESELAYLFLIYECYFISQKNNKYTILSMIMCILSFKRLSCIFSIYIYILVKFIDISKGVNKRTVMITTAFFALLPILTCIAINNNIDGYLYSKYRISLNEITLTRTQRLELVLKSDQIKYGLGSTTTYLTEKLNTIHNSDFEQRNLHNDLVKIYLECGIVGLLAILYAYLKNFSVTRISFLLIIYILMECYLNHLFGAGTSQLWIIIYIFLASQNIENEQKMEAINGENMRFYTNI